MEMNLLISNSLEYKLHQTITMKKVTVIGATGMIGIPVTQQLIKAGFEVTALVRNPSKAAEIFPSGVRFVKGDLNDVDTITKSLEHADAVYVNISTRPQDKEGQFNPETEGLNNILRAAKASSVQQIVYLSSLLARNYTGNWWVFKAKKSSIERVKQSGIPYTILYPSNFMENYTSEGMKRGKKITVIKSKFNNKAYWISGEDFGQVVAASLQQPRAINREFTVQGPEALTMLEAANSFIQGYQKEVLSVGFFPLGMMKFLGNFIGPLKFVGNLMTVMLSNKETFESTNTNEELHHSTITIHEFAAKQ